MTNQDKQNFNQMVSAVLIVPQLMFYALCRAIGMSDHEYQGVATGIAIQAFQAANPLRQITELRLVVMRSIAVIEAELDVINQKLSKTNAMVRVFTDEPWSFRPLVIGILQVILLLALWLALMSTIHLVGTRISSSGEIADLTGEFFRSATLATPIAFIAMGVGHVLMDQLENDQLRYRVLIICWILGGLSLICWFLGLTYGFPLGLAGIDETDDFLMGVGKTSAWQDIAFNGHLLSEIVLSLPVGHWIIEQSLMKKRYRYEQSPESLALIEQRAQLEEQLAEAALYLGKIDDYQLRYNAQEQVYVQESLSFVEVQRDLFHSDHLKALAAVKMTAVGQKNFPENPNEKEA